MDNRTMKKLERCGIGVVETKSPQIPNTELDLDSINEVNAEIRHVQTLLEANFRIKRENDANRRNLRKLLIDLHERRRNLCQVSS